MSNNAQISFLIDKKRIEYQKSRTWVRYLLEKYLNKPPEILYQKKYKKPYIHGNPLHMNWSNDEAMLALALHHRPIGIDALLLNTMRFDKSIIERFFHPNEQNLIQEKSDLALKRFYLCFTRKEAWIKAQGLGIYAYPLHKIDTTGNHFENWYFDSYIMDQKLVISIAQDKKKHPAHHPISSTSSTVYTHNAL